MVTFDSCRLITGHYTQTFSSHDNAATNPPGYGDARRRAFEHIRDWEAQRGIDVTTGRFQSIWVQLSDDGFGNETNVAHTEQVNQSRTLVPLLERATNRRGPGQVDTFHSGNGYKLRLVRVKTGLYQEWPEQITDLLIACFRPFDLRLVEKTFSLRHIASPYLIKLVDCYDNLADTKTANKKQVLSGLSTALESCFKLANGGIHDKQSRVGLGCSRNHVWDEVSMSWCVQDRNDSMRSVQCLQRDVHGNATVYQFKTERQR